MASLKTTQSFDRPDDVYQKLTEIHRELSAQDSLKLNAKLILLLANHIGDEDVINEAIVIAVRNQTKAQSFSKLV